MPKNLHMYNDPTKKHKWDNNAANGIGDPSETDDFSVTVTSGKVIGGQVYMIKQGQQTIRPTYTCRTGASTGKNENHIASFHFLADAAAAPVLVDYEFAAASRAWRSSLLTVSQNMPPLKSRSTT